MEEKLIEKVKEKIQHIIDEDINTNNLEHLYKLIDIYKDAKEVESMNYGRRPGYDSYGNYNEYREGYNEYGRDYGNYNGYREGYGRRGVDSKYRGYGHLDRMAEEYGRYSYGRERYGANEDTKKSLKYMLESMEDFARMLREEAQSQDEVEMIRQTAQRIAQM